MNGKRLKIASLGLGMILALSCAVAAEQEVPKQRSTQPFMRQKLAYANGILEGITLEKFDLVVTNAVRLRDMSHTNSFLILGNPEYTKRIKSFQASVDLLTAAAKDRDLEKATESYQKVTGGCIECHRFFRREQNRHFGEVKSSK
jgi:Cytochrome C'